MGAEVQGLEAIKRALVKTSKITAAVKAVGYQVFNFVANGPRWAWLQAHEWAWFSSLFLGACTVASVNEFGVAAMLACISAIACLSQLIKWTALASSRWIVLALKTTGVVVIIFLLICILGVLNVYRADRPWSQLPEAYKDALILIHPLTIDTRVVPPGVAATSPAPTIGKIDDKVVTVARKVTSTRRQPVGDRASDENISVTIGQSVDSRYAFETRFILANRTSGRLTKACYQCKILNENTDKLELNHPIIQNAISVSPLEDLPDGLERSVYCDFSSDPIANQLDSPIVQILVNYVVNNREESKGFRFFAKRKPEDKSYVWFPAGEPAPVSIPQR